MWRVSSLPVPAQSEWLAADALRQCEAVRLFADRAAAVTPAFSITDDNAATVADICRRLDGIPKAGAVDGDILRELTATFTPPEIVELTMSICLFNVFNRFNDVLGSGTDLDLAPLELYPRPLQTTRS